MSRLINNLDAQVSPIITNGIFRDIKTNTAEEKIEAVVKVLYDRPGNLVLLSDIDRDLELSNGQIINVEVQIYKGSDYDEYVSAISSGNFVEVQQPSLSMFDDAELMMTYTTKMMCISGTYTDYDSESDQEVESTYVNYFIEDSPNEDLTEHHLYDRVLCIDYYDNEYWARIYGYDTSLNPLDHHEITYLDILNGIGVSPMYSDNLDTQDSYKVIVNETNGVMIVVYPNKSRFNEGDEITLKTTNKANYELTSISVVKMDGSDELLELTESSAEFTNDYSFIMPACDVRVLPVVAYTGVVFDPGTGGGGWSSGGNPPKVQP